MGPPPFSDGNVTHDGEGRRRFFPSMGPPPFSDGNPANGQVAIGNGHRFNGATAFQRWKLVHIRLEPNPDDPLQWGHRLSAMETSCLGRRCWPGPTSFNGATAFQRWKQKSDVAAWIDDYALQWGHRLSAMETRRSCCRPSPGLPSFNGATAFRRWK